LNTIDSRNPEIDNITDTDRDAPTGDELDNDEDSTSGGECGQPEYGNLALQRVENPEQTMSMDNEGSRSPYGVLTLNDVIPIESTRARFLQLIIDFFITYHVVPAAEMPEGNSYSPNGKEKSSKKRKNREAQYEGDSRYLLPLTFVANLYETLIREINQRLATVEGLQEKTFGVALEAAGGLYRRLVKKFPKSESEDSVQSSNCFPTSPNTLLNTTFKRREMASALEARTKFPQLVTGEEKRVRFVVVHGLELVERPNLTPEDAEWFKRLTGRHEAQIYESDYKFFAARVKHRRPPQHNLSSMSMMQPYPGSEPSANLSPPQLRQQAFEPHVMECQPYASRDPGVLQPHLIQHQHHQQHSPHVQHQHVQHTGHTPPHMPRDLDATGMHGPIVVQHQPTGPSKYCDECGSAYYRETSKFCSECGTKRLGVM
jgi:pentatricopeptide repeat domain-containing protein 1